MNKLINFALKYLGVESMIVENNKNSGINRKDTQKILINFLEDENLKVLALKGKWGGW